MRNKFWILFLFVIVLSSFWACSQKDPIGIEQFQLAFPDSSSSPAINSSLLTDGIDFSIGYYNGNIHTDRISLEWQASTDEDFLCYKIFKAIGQYEDDPTLEYIETLNDHGNTTFIDSTLVQDQYYIYKIATIFNNGTHITDDIEIKTPKWQTPSYLTANGLSTTDVQLMWDDNSDSEENFKVYLYDNAERSLIDSFLVAANITEKTITDLDPIGIYSFNVKAINQWEEDTNLSPQEWFDMTDFVFDPPSDLTCNQNSDMSIELNWIDNSTLETGFSIERKINSSEFIEIVEIDLINTTSYTDIDTTAYEVGDDLTYRVRAFNNYGNLEYTDYSNECTLIVSEPPEFIVIGTGSEEWSYPFHTYYHDARTQTLYLQSEIQNSGNITKIEYNISELLGQTMNNFVVRLKHTPISYFSNSFYDNYGYTICYTENLIISENGWVEIEFTTPFYYNGIDNLIIDVSFDNDFYTANGTCYATDTLISRSIVRHTDSGLGDPLYWDYGDLSDLIPNIRLYFN